MDIPANELELPNDVTAGDMNFFNGKDCTRIEKPTNQDFKYTLEWDFANNKPF